MGQVDDAGDREPDRGQQQHLLADEHLPRGEQAEHDAVTHRAVALGEPQHPVDDQRHEELRHEVRVAVGVRDHAGREADEARADRRGERVHRQSAAEQPEPGGCRECQAEQLDDEEGRRRPREQGERGERDAEPEHRGVGHQVDAVREVLQVAEQRVGQRHEVVRRRAEVPLERLLVLHALREVARAQVGDEARHHPGGGEEVGQRGPQVRPAQRQRHGASGSRVLVAAGCRTGSRGRLVLPRSRPGDRAAVSVSPATAAAGVGAAGAGAGSPVQAGDREVVPREAGLERVDDRVDLVHPVAAHLGREAGVDALVGEPVGRRDVIRGLAEPDEALGRPGPAEQPGHAEHHRAAQHGEEDRPGHGALPAPAAARASSPSTTRVKSTDPEPVPRGPGDAAQPRQPDLLGPAHQRAGRRHRVGVDADLGPAVQEAADLDQAQPVARLERGHHHPVGGGERAQPGPRDDLGAERRARPRAPRGR